MDNPEMTMCCPKFILEKGHPVVTDVVQETLVNIYDQIKQLWHLWSHLGVSPETNMNNMKLKQMEKELHRDLLAEIKQKVDEMEAEVRKLQEKRKEVSRCLSMELKAMEHKKLLEDENAGYRELIDQRLRKFDRLLEWQRDLAEKLGDRIYDLQEMPLPSEEELNKFYAHLEVLQAERDKRADIFLNTQIKVKDIMDKLQIQTQNNFEYMVVTSLSVDFKVTDLNMDRLAKLHQDLQERYEQTNNRVLKLRERLAKLWDCLEEDLIYRDNFLLAHPGCNPDTEMALKEEIKRCEQIKRQEIQKVIGNVRTKIKLMWDNIMYSEEQRAEFVSYNLDVYSEDTLTSHEIYLEKITKLYNELKPIFDLIITRKNLWLKMTELEARASEPGRYHNRGGLLLKEEKERKPILHNLPKIEAQICDLVMEYEAKTNTTFTVDGKPLLQLMADEWETWRSERHDKLSARKQTLTLNTPLLRSLALSPRDCTVDRDRFTNHRAQTLHSSKINSPSPSKRQLITGSANKALTTISNTFSAMKRSASNVKSHLSGRLGARAEPDSKTEHTKRKLDYGSDKKKKPKATLKCSILKRMRMSNARRRSSGHFDDRDALYAELAGRRVREQKPFNEDHDAHQLY